MNKRIFSLVCIVLYALLAVSIHCSEQKDARSKESGLKSKIIRAIKKIKGNNNNNEPVDFEANFNMINSHHYQKLLHRRSHCCGLCFYYEEY
ncbi:hypothetical protein PCHDK_000556800 [Plasmodium chabaudi adami]|uniref:Fam-c protein n=1 Tax=Plasmodium chabaudi adami TaxID=5826 RepID=A0A1D3LBH5_PLACE|nr:hypothetical protein PCHDK_000556800 [Plasmodium chabaudi adami]